MLNVKQTLDDFYRAESRRVFATLVRILGDFDLAEDSMHEAFVLAAEKWPESGIPDNPAEQAANVLPPALQHLNEMAV